MRLLKVYWRTVPTKTIPIGYFVPLLKIADLLDAGCQVKNIIS